MIELNDLGINKTLTLQKKITTEDTSLDYGSGKIENLFATTTLVAFMIEASSQLVDPMLPEGFVSVGTHVEVDHFKSTMVGATVSVEVKIEEAKAGKFMLSMNAYDEVGKIGEGKHSRMVVNYNKLLEKANEREKDIRKEEF